MAGLEGKFTEGGIRGECVWGKRCMDVVASTIAEGGEVVKMLEEGCVEGPGAVVSLKKIQIDFLNLLVTFLFVS